METEAYGQFEEWLKEQPYWLQDATWRIYHNNLIDDKQIGAYVQMCIDQSQKKKPNYKTLSKNSIIPLNSQNKIAIHSITDVLNVNALANNTKIEFGSEGVSVVYGLNGAGKSGFMRIFKRVCNNPYAELIQQNVFTKKDDKKPSCVLNISLDSKEESIICDLSSESNNAILRQCDVFDTMISSAYIAYSNDVSYEPFIFTALKELANVADRIDYFIKERIGQISDISLDIPSCFETYEWSNWLRNISKDSVIPEECIIWEKKDEDRIEELKNLLDEKQVENEIKTLKIQKEQIDSVLSELKNIKSSFLGDYFLELKDAYNELEVSKDQYLLANSLFVENAYNQDKISVSIGAWKNLWKYGKEYYETCLHNVNGNGFGKKGSVCPLCLQELDGEVLTRFAIVDEFVNGSCNEKYEKKQEIFEKKYNNLLAHSFTSEMIKTMLNGIIDDDLIKNIQDFYKKLEIWLLSDNKEQSYEEIKQIKDIEVVEKLEKISTDKNKRIGELLNSKNTEKREELKNELFHEQYRKWVYEQKGLISSIINNKKTIEELTSAQSLTKTNRISKESNLLAEKLITEAYIERFNKEIKLLSPNLKVKIEKDKSIKGKSPYRVVLDTEDKERKNPQKILSEGEQRIVALAAFFVDATGRKELTPIIIDDPISSLDYNYEESATKRIVELAKQRQVIVFTHRISLLVGLSEKCKDYDVNFTERYIRGTAQGKGVSDFEDTFHGNIKAQLDGLKKRINETKAMDPFSREYIDSCSRISQQLRICVERSVEDILFQQMVKRFTRKITTGKLLKMDRITSEDCHIVDNMMTKYSFYEHSQPEDSCLINRDLDEVIKDIEAYIEWINDYTKRINQT